MKVAKTTITQLVITEAVALDPVRVMIENMHPGAGSITITCFGKSWTSYWGAMSDRTVEQFFMDCNDSYLVNCLSCGISSTLEGEDNDANIEFVKREIRRLRRADEMSAEDARECWDAAENCDEIKDACCHWHSNSPLRKVFGDEPWHAGWPTIPNPDYQYLKHIVQVVREGIRHASEPDAVALCYQCGDKTSQIKHGDDWHCEKCHAYQCERVRCEDCAMTCTRPDTGHFCRNKVL